MKTEDLKVEDLRHLNKSRRLEKPPLRNDAVKKQSQSGGVNEPSEKPRGGCCGESRRGPVESRPKSRLSVGSSVELDWAGPVERKEKEGEEGCFGNFGSGAEYGNDLGVEASFGENNLDFEARDRSTRETTPCSFIRESDTIGTPGSTTRRTSSISTHRRVRNNVQRNIPTTLEMEEFFARHEEEQQKIFIEKYNFDIINDLPLPGRVGTTQRVHVLFGGKIVSALLVLTCKELDFVMDIG
ncbi:unnamed protein product [Malus baccata var. baccata]